MSLFPNNNFNGIQHLKYANKSIIFVDFLFVQLFYLFVQCHFDILLKLRFTSMKQHFASSRLKPQGLCFFIALLALKNTAFQVQILYMGILLPPFNKIYYCIKIMSRHTISCVELVYAFGVVVHFSFNKKGQMQF